MRRSLLIFAFLIAGLSSGCGGGSGSQDADGLAPRAWAESACGSVREWMESGEAKAAEIQSGPPPESLSEARGLMIEIFDHFAVVGREKIADIEALRPIDAERGAEFERDFIAFLENFRSAMEELSQRAREMSITSPEAFKAELDDLIADMDTELAAVSRNAEALNEEYPDPALQEPFSELEDCKAVAAGGE